MSQAIISWLWTMKCKFLLKKNIAVYELFATALVVLWKCVLCLCQRRSSSDYGLWNVNFYWKNITFYELFATALWYIFMLWNKKKYFSKWKWKCKKTPRSFFIYIYVPLLLCSTPCRSFMSRWRSVALYDNVNSRRHVVGAVEHGVVGSLVKERVKSKVCCIKTRGIFFNFFIYVGWYGGLCRHSHRC